MKILALAIGETPNGMLTYAILWENKMADVKLLRFIEEPMKLNYDSSHVLMQGPIEDILWHAKHRLDPSVFGRRMAKEDYDYSILLECYNKLIKKSNVFLDYQHWESEV